MAVRSWAHRRGIARGLSAEYAAGRYRQAYVQVALPCRWLARLAANAPWRSGPRFNRVGKFERWGLFHYRVLVWPEVYASNPVAKHAYPPSDLRTYRQ